MQCQSIKDTRSKLKPQVTNWETTVKIRTTKISTQYLLFFFLIKRQLKKRQKNEQILSPGNSQTSKPEQTHEKALCLTISGM